MGTKRKFWFEDDDGVRWLFKYPRSGTGEHWAEKIAAEIGPALGVPCARVELATCAGVIGSISGSFAQDHNLSLVHGNELLQEVDSSYPVAQLRGVSKHTVSAVLERLEPMQPPVDNSELPSAADWFVGYLLLDAVIANSDRHHENWGVLQQTSTDVRRLAPSYDHASSLGRELRDERRRERLATRDPRHTVDFYIGRARSAIFHDVAAKKPLHPTEAFLLAKQYRARAGQAWLARLDDLSDNTFEDIVARLPDTIMSELSRRFALRMLATTRQTILRESADTANDRS